MLPEVDQQLEPFELPHPPVAPPWLEAYRQYGTAFFTEPENYPIKVVQEIVNQSELSASLKEEVNLLLLILNDIAPDGFIFQDVFERFKN